MEETKRIIEIIGLKSTSKSTLSMNKLHLYESAKRALQSKGLSPKEYEAEIKKIVKRLKI